MKTLLMRLNRCERNSNRRKANLVIFTRLQRCRNLQEAAVIYRNARVLLNSVTASNETDSAREALASNVSTNYIEMEEIDVQEIHCEELKRVKGAVNATKLPESFHTGLEREKQSSFHNEEEGKWREKRRHKKYSDTKLSRSWISNG